MNFRCDGEASENDSDYVDEEIEHQLYASVFFGHISSPLSTFPIEGSEVGSPYFPSRDISSNIHETDIGRAGTLSFNDESSLRPECFIADHKSTDSSSPTTDEDTDSEYEIDSSSPLPLIPQLNSSNCAWKSDQLVLGNMSNVHCKQDREAIAKLLESKSDDPMLWQIDPADYAYPERKNRDSRYFRSEKDPCSKCGLRGHNSFQCENRGPVCIFCGSQDHLRDGCPELYCFACLSPGHSKKHCDLLSQLKQSTCARCGLKGHDSRTRAGKPVPIPLKSLKQPRECCNCGRHGHTVDQCKRQSHRSNFIGPPPRHRVFVYDKKNIYRKKTLKALFMSERKRLRRNRGQMKRIANPSFNDASMDSGDSFVMEQTKRINRHLVKQVEKQKNRKSMTNSTLASENNVLPAGSTALDRIKFRRPSLATEDSFLPLDAPNPARHNTNKGRVNRKSRNKKRRPNGFFSFQWDHCKINSDELPTTYDTSATVLPDEPSESVSDIPVPGKMRSQSQKSDPSLASVEHSASNHHKIPLKRWKHSGHSARDKRTLRTKPETVESTPRNYQRKKRVRHSNELDTDLLHFAQSSLHVEPWESTTPKVKPGKKREENHSTTDFLEAFIC